MFIDSHAHLEFEDFVPDLDQVVLRAQEAKVEKIITLGVDVKRAQQAIEIAEKYPQIYAAIGIHPDDVKNTDVVVALNVFEKMIASHSKIVAIGETGIDYYRTSPEDLAHEMKIQEEALRAHIKLAQKHSLPVIIHLRGDGAYEHAVRIVKDYAPLKGVVHCFSEGVEEARECIDLGLLISFTGIVTFKNAKEMQEVAKIIPLNKIMIETDSPYLAPDPFRGKRNEPSYVVHVAEKIAEIRDISVSKVGQVTTQTAKQFFTI